MPRARALFKDVATDLKLLILSHIEINAQNKIQDYYGRFDHDTSYGQIIQMF
jgi:hypothetical protein